MEAFDGLTDLPAAKAKLATLRAAHDAAQERLAAVEFVPTVIAKASDWNDLTLESGET